MPRRLRTLKYEFFLNETLATLPALVRILFEGLWCIADREGRLEDRPIRIKAEVLPYDECDVDEYLNMLANTHDEGHPFIHRYEVDGKRYIEIVNFLKHQNPHIREAASLIPGPREGRRQTGSTVQAPCKPGTSTNLGTPVLESGILSSGSGVLDPETVPDGTVAPGVRKRPRTAPTPTPTALTWLAYRNAYERRYGAQPPNNAKSMGQITHFVQRVGADDAPKVADWFLSHDGGWYIKRLHALDCLIKDAEALHTQWKTGKRVSEHSAREADRLQATGDMWREIKEEARAGSVR